MADNFNFNMEDFNFDDYNDTHINESLPFPTDVPRPEIQPYQLVLLLGYGFVFLLGVPGNALVVWVTGFRMTRSVNSVWFLNLAVADLLCCLSLPLLMVPLAHDYHWHFGAVACTLVNGLFYLVMYCSVLLLVVISLDRLLLVIKPVWCQNYRRPRQASAVCVGVWCLALLGTIPQFKNYKQIEAGKWKRECLVSTTQSDAWIITSFRFLFGFLLPFLAIVVSHWVVYTKAVSGGSSRSSGARTKRMVRVIVAVAMSFFLCWLPLNVLDFIILGTPRKSDQYPIIHLTHGLALCLAYLNSCINPLLYVCLGRGFKETMGRSLRSVFNFINEEPSTARPSITNNNSKSTGTTSSNTVV